MTQIQNLQIFTNGQFDATKTRQNGALSIQPFVSGATIAANNLTARFYVNVVDWTAATAQVNQFSNYGI
jgi:hypothetical protein